MATHELRIKCLVAGRTIGSKEKVGFLGLPSPAPPIRVLLPELQARRGQWGLTLNALGLESEQAARAIAEPLKTALLLTGPLLGIWIDVATRRGASVTSQGSGGLQIVPEASTSVASTPARAEDKEPISLREFERAVVTSYAAGKRLSKKEVLPAALYNESYFHSTSASRFLSLMNALEVMAVPAEKSPAAKALVEQMIRSVSQPGMLPQKAEQDCLIRGISQLRRQSIPSASRDLVRSLCGEDAVDLHDRAYFIRNAMVLEGRPRQEVDLAQECSNLDELVKQLVVKRVIGE